MPPRPFREPSYTPPRPRGRPRKPANGTTDRHNMGTANAGSRVDSGGNIGAQALIAVAPVAPRLLDLPNAALYMTVNAWTLREMVNLGVLPRVRFALPNTKKRHGGEYRKLLFDRADLDQLIERSKERKELAL